MKKIILSTLFMVLSLVLVTPVFASETDNQKLENLSEKGEIIYIDDEITVRSFGNDTEASEAIFNHPDSVTSTEIMPFSAVNGPGGRASIVSGNSGRIVYWSVTPATSWPYSFAGVVKLRYHSGFKRDAYVVGSGLFGQSSSGSVTMNQNNGGTAYLEGTAHSLTGSLHKVLPGVHTAF